ncbi:hypothetical protein LC653_06870 [Nostoc sp. CHAB 5784]|uniref:hypothetical protein n=1 Tax=Nostoc mirabile TaxID=2907820 RepID=UPI001E4D5582|nr:hypothetical protein [Nostoc mirabile]MCC5663656.1 hypothetical protein [Nostoc mirabile CHAB5784]
MTSTNSSRLRFNPIFENIKDIKEFLHKIPMWRFFLSPIKKKCQNVKNLISCIEKQLIEEIDIFSQFNQSLNNCHSLISEVLLARQQVHKAALLIYEAKNYKPMATNNTENSYGKISSAINRLAITNNSESDRGELDSLLKLIRDSIKDLKSCSEDDVKRVIYLFNNIATHYTDMEIIISKIIASILIS